MTPRLGAITVTWRGVIVEISNHNRWEFMTRDQLQYFPKRNLAIHNGVKHEQGDEYIKRTIKGQEPFIRIGYEQSKNRIYK